MVITSLTTIAVVEMGGQMQMTVHFMNFMKYKGQFTGGLFLLADTHKLSGHPFLCGFHQLGLSTHQIYKEGGLETMCPISSNIL